MESDKDFTEAYASAMTPGYSDIVLSRLHVEALGASVRGP